MTTPAIYPNDNALFTLLGIILNAALVQRGLTGVVVQQAEQPTQQGVPKGPVVLMTKIGPDIRFGFLQENDAYDSDQQKMIHTEKQYTESTFQLGVLYPQNASALTYTASDLTNICAGIMQSSATRAALKLQGVSILRIREVRNPYFTDDKDRFEANPSFDFVLCYEQVYTTEIPVIQSTEFTVTPV